MKRTGIWSESIVKAVARGERKRRKLANARRLAWLRSAGLRRMPREGLIG